MSTLGVARAPAGTRDRDRVDDDVLDGTVAAADLGTHLGGALREWLVSLPATELAERLIGGIAYWSRDRSPKFAAVSDE